MDEETPEKHDKSTRPYILVDGSNVAYGSGSFKRPKIEVINAVLGELHRHQFRVVTFVDAKLRHVINEPQEMEKLVDDGVIIQAPAGRDADDILLQLALNRQSHGETVYILTNDMFPVKRAKGVVPRIAFVVVPLGDTEEVIFSPPLESLIEHAEEKIPTPSQSLPTPSDDGPVQEEPVVRIDSDLLDAFMSFVITFEPPVGIGSRIPFAHVAGYLHNQFDGGFCARFGYGKPKEFASALEENGYVRLRREGAPLYLEIRKKLMDKCAEGSLEMDKSISRVPTTLSSKESKESLLQRALELLREDHHFPTEERIFAKLRSLAPKKRMSTKKLLAEGVKRKLLSKQKKGGAVYFWPEGKRWEATDPGDPEDSYSPELWQAFKKSLHQLPSHQRIAQTRYYLAKSLRAVGVPEIESLPQARCEHMVQLAVNKSLLRVIRTPMGPRINVPAHD